MKRFLIAASCFSLIAPAIVEAQGNPQDNGKPEHQAKPAKPAGGPQGGGGGNQPNYKPAPNYGGPNRPGNPGGGGGNQPNYKPAPNYGGPNHPANPGGGGAGQPNYRPGPNYGGNGGRPNYRPGYSGSGQRRYGAWNGQRFRGGNWRWPRGYGYQRWWIGGILPALFLSQAYWFDDYASLGFGPPPYGCEWVRYGPDLLLVNIDSGQIIDVEYGVFD